MYLDIAFVLDSTGSMGSYINTAKAQIVKIAEDVNKKKDIDKVRFAVIQYRDHPPEDKTFVAW